MKFDTQRKETSKNRAKQVRSNCYLVQKKNILLPLGSHVGVIRYLKSQNHSIVVTFQGHELSVLSCGRGDMVWDKWNEYINSLLQAPVPALYYGTKVNKIKCTFNVSNACP